MHNRLSLMKSLKALQKHIQDALIARVEKMSFKPRLYRLAEHLKLSPGEVRAFVFIVLSCAGIEVPGAEDRRQGIRPKAELFNCRNFSGLAGHELLDFLSPSRAHFSQGLLEIEDEFAGSYPESKFRAPREVLKAIYGGQLTLDEAMTLGNSALSTILAEESDSVLNGHLGVLPSTKPDKLRGISDVAVDDIFTQTPNARERTTDGGAMLDLLSELHSEDSRRNAASSSKKQTSTEAGNEDSMSGEDLDTEEDNNGYMENGTNIDSTDDEHPSDADVKAYTDDMQYLKDGFEVVREACKVYNFREKNSEEDRYTHTKRPVEALQREADAKMRKATTLFTRRLNKTKQVDDFMPRLELLVSKLKLVHFERMVILTLGKFRASSLLVMLCHNICVADASGMTCVSALDVIASLEIRITDIWIRN